MLTKKFGSAFAIVAMTMGAGLAGATFLTTEANAQAYDKISQGFQRGPSGQVRLSPRDTAAMSGDETELLSSLTGVVIVDDPKAIRTGGTSATGVETRSDVTPDGVVSAAGRYVGQPVSLASLDRMTRDMVLAFRNAGMPVVNVVVPPQDVSNGVVQIITVVGRVGEVTVSGNAENASQYVEAFPLQRDEVVDEAVILDYLRWRSRRFHRSVSAVYSPGATFSATDIALEVNEDKPWTVFAGADNSGSGTIGDYRFFTGFTLGNLWGMDHEFSYQFTTSEEGTDALNAHAAIYTMPVWDNADLQFTAAYVKSEGPTAAGLSKGESSQLGIALIQQLSRLGPWSSDLRTGFEYKKSDSDFEFGGTTAFTTDTEVGQFFAQVTSQRSSAKSVTNAHLGVWWSPGGMFGDNTDAAFNGARAGSQAAYAYLRAGIDHTIYLPEDFRFNIDVDGQVASARLVPSEMMYLGGLNSVRGFEENAVRGDSGVVVRLELQGPGFKIFDNGTPNELRPYAFFDAGAVSTREPLAATEGDAGIAGAGVGLLFQLGDNISAEAAYGWKVDEDNQITDMHDGHFHFRLLGKI